MAGARSSIGSNLDLMSVPLLIKNSISGLDLNLNLTANADLKPKTCKCCFRQTTERGAGSAIGLPMPSASGWGSPCPLIALARPLGASAGTPARSYIVAVPMRPSIHVALVIRRRGRRWAERSAWYCGPDAHDDLWIVQTSCRSEACPGFWSRLSTTGRRYGVYGVAPCSRGLCERRAWTLYGCWLRAESQVTASIHTAAPTPLPGEKSRPALVRRRSRRGSHLSSVV